MLKCPRVVSMLRLDLCIYGDLRCSWWILAKILELMKNSPKRSYYLVVRNDILFKSFIICIFLIELSASFYS